MWEFGNDLAISAFYSLCFPPAIPHILFIKVTLAIGFHRQDDNKDFPCVFCIAACLSKQVAMCDITQWLQVPQGHHEWDWHGVSHNCLYFVLS